MLAVTYSKTVASVPYSVFADLGKPSAIEISREKGLKTYSVKLVGGDAALSYVATIKFDGDVLIERTVRSGEFPEQSWERT